MVWVVFQVFQPTNDIQRSCITLQQSSVFWRFFPVNSSRTSHDPREFQQTLPTKKVLSAPLRLQTSEHLESGAFDTTFWQNAWWGHQSIGHKSLINLWNKLCISCFRIYQDVANMFIKKTRVFAWYLPDRSPKCFALFILTGTGVADGSCWDSKAKANEAVTYVYVSLTIWYCHVLSGSGFICKMNAQGSLHNVYITYI